MKKLFKFLFNTDGGYFLKEVFYDYKGRTELGFIICKGYRMFGIFGYDKIAACGNIDDVNETVKRLGITLT